MLLNAQGQPIQSEQSAQQQQTAEQVKMGKLMNAVIQALAANQATNEDGVDVGVNLMLYFFGSRVEAKDVVASYQNLQRVLGAHVGKIIQDKKAAERAARQLQRANQQGAPS